MVIGEEHCPWHTVWDACIIFWISIGPISCKLKASSSPWWAVRVPGVWWWTPHLLVLCRTCRKEWDVSPAFWREASSYKDYCIFEDELSMSYLPILDHDPNLHCITFCRAVDEQYARDISVRIVLRGEWNIQKAGHIQYAFKYALSVKC